MSATIAVGLISGTSVDAIDAAACELHFGDDGVLAMRPLGHCERPWPAGLRERILALLPPAATTVGEVCALDNEIGRAFAAVAVRAVRELAGGSADLVASLGQTVFHDVRDGQCHGTLQLGQPAWIAEATGLPVVSDLRSADVAAGGNGAPLASTLDVLWLGGSWRPRAALNLGGIANATVVGDGVLAFDTGPANCLLDLVIARLTDGARPYDTDGALAGSGTVREDLLAVLADHPYFAEPPPKTCGREVFGAGYLDAALARVPAVDAIDLMATLTELTALTVADALAPYHLTEVVASGGGVRNPTLMRALRRRIATPQWRTSGEAGLPPEAKEAYLSRWLARDRRGREVPKWLVTPYGSPRGAVLARHSGYGARRRRPHGHRCTPCHRPRPHHRAVAGRKATHRDHADAAARTPREPHLTASA